MDAARDGAWRRLCRRWLSPPRRGLQRLIIPCVDRRLRFFGAANRLDAGVPASAGGICVSDGASGWATLFFAVVALCLAGGWWYRSNARTAAPGR